MLVNTNFDDRIVVDTLKSTWVLSPVPGVERKLLDRLGAEEARATSIVGYAAGSSFTPHEHPLGEEFLVLSGVFSDEHGDYPAGTYVRHPPGSRHTAYSDKGCELFVKVRQFDVADSKRVVIDTPKAIFRQGLVPGLKVLPLHEFGTEHTALVQWAPGTKFQPHTHWGGEEIFVLEGVFSDEHGDYPAGTWIRSPHMSLHKPYSDVGCLIYVKVGHLV
ncbi:MAG: cupin domain-containing protein [Fluviibacter sp.]